MGGHDQVVYSALPRWLVPAAVATYGRSVMTGWMAIDAGQTAVRARASWRPDIVTGPAFRDPDDDPIAAALASVRPVLSDLGPGELPLVIAIGHTSLPELPEDRDQFARLVCAELITRQSVSAAIEVMLFADAVAAHAGALSGRPGVVLAVGTGTVCLGIDQAGNEARVDGVGHWVGDEGSAFDLGRSGLRVAARHEDGRESAPMLYDLARRHLIDDLDLGPDLGAALRRLGRIPDRVRATAAFARLVIDCARVGEPAAVRLIKRAAAALAETVTACCTRIDPPAPDRRIACVGGMFDSGDELLGPFTEALDLPDWRVVPADGTVLDGVVRLARAPGELHAALAHFRKGP